MNVVEFILAQPAHILWLVGGFLFLFIGMLIGEPTTAALGFAAIITAIAALSVSTVGAQLLIWGILSVSLAVVMRGMVPRESRELRHATEAEVVDPIPPRGEGHVAYEGSVWKARCHHSSETGIANGQRVYVIGREGNTLIVVPNNFPDSNIFDQSV